VRRATFDPVEQVSPPLTAAPTLHLEAMSCLRAGDCRYVCAIDDEESLGVGSGVFPGFLQGELANIRSTRGTSRSGAERANNEFARRRRDTLRDLLRAAARRGLLPWGITRLAHFAEGRDSSEAAVFINLDEDLEGDSEFNPIPISE
jgi:hypothetical protein